MGWGMMDYGFGWFGFGWFGMLIFWFLIIFTAIYLVRWLVSDEAYKRTRDENRALDILKERYAKGEIDKREFEEKKKAIK